MRGISVLRRNVGDGSRVHRNFFRVRLSHQGLRFTAVAADCSVGFLASFAGQALWGFMSATPAQDIAIALGVGLLASLTFVLVAQSAGQYSLAVLTQPVRYIRRTLGLSLTVGLSLTAALFLLKTGAAFSRGAIILFVVFHAVGMATVRLFEGLAFRRMLARGAIAGRRMVVLGDAQELNSLSAMALLFQFGFSEAARIVLPNGETNALADLRGAIDAARDCNASGFCVAVDWGEQKRLAALQAALRNSPLPVELIPDRRVRSVLLRRLPGSTGHSMVVTMQRAPLSRVERAGKRLFDVILSSVALVILAPIMIAAAIAIKLETRGPIIFRQSRKGFDQKSFLIFKFRSMSVLENGQTIRQASRGDARVTRVGAVLRRTSVDELPQLVNVLRGEMSLVGPRPHAVVHDEFYGNAIDTYCLRHHVKPGITGWAQVKGFRGETLRMELMQARVEHDIWYVDNWSPLLDLMIIFRTGLTLLNTNAY